MKRRAFLQSSLAATCLPLAASALRAADEASEPQHLVWTRYGCDNVQQREQVSSFLARAALPALGRLGIQPVGVFTDLEPNDSSSLYVWPR